MAPFEQGTIAHSQSPMIWDRDDAAVVADHQPFLQQNPAESLALYQHRLANSATAESRGDDPWYEACSEVHEAEV
jgi:hypothetical protein